MLSLNYNFHFGFPDDSNPYAPRAPLNVLKSDKDRDWIIEVGGFEEMNRIDQHLSGAALDSEPVFFVVSGKQKSGRKTIASYILAQYCLRRGISPEDFVVPENFVAKDFGKLATFTRWASELENDLYFAGYIDQTILDEFDSTITAMSDSNMDSKLRFIFKRIVTILAAANRNAAGFGCCLQAVRGREIIEASLRMFRDVPTVCVFTIGDYEPGQEDVLEPLKNDLGVAAKILFVELRELNGQDVENLSLQRWRQARGNEPCPLEGADLKCAFDTKQAIGRALALLGQLLDFHIAQNGGKPYPANTGLTCSPEQARNVLKLAENLGPNSKDWQSVLNLVKKWTVP